MVEPLWMLMTGPIVASCQVLRMYASTVSATAGDLSTASGRTDTTKAVYMPSLSLFLMKNT